VTKQLAVEFLIEPFSEGTPGPHVEAALSAFAERKIAVEMGPFANTAEGPIDDVTAAMADAFKRAVEAGATSVRVQLAPEATSLTGRNLHDALPEMLRELESDHGPLDGWDRAIKQAAVRSLSDRGAFLLRGSIDDVAEAMGVSRITIYNYLNALGE
jgi:uncharacterized protein YqgV (UPF0045/DUF77 family)